MIASGPEAFAAYLKAEVAKWAAVVKAAGLKPRREGNRVYFPDLDGIEVQVAGS